MPSDEIQSWFSIFDNVRYNEALDKVLVGYFLWRHKKATNNTNKRYQNKITHYQWKNLHK